VWRECTSTAETGRPSPSARPGVPVQGQGGQENALSISRTRDHYTPAGGLRRPSEQLDLRPRTGVMTNRLAPVLVLLLYTTILWPAHRSHEGDWRWCSSRMKGTAARLGSAGHRPVRAHAYAESSLGRRRADRRRPPGDLPGPAARPPPISHPGWTKREGWYYIVDGGRPAPSSSEDLPTSPQAGLRGPGTWGDTLALDLMANRTTRARPGPAQHPYLIPPTAPRTSVGLKPKNAKNRRADAARRNGELWVRCDFRSTAAEFRFRCSPPVTLARGEGRVPPRRSPSTLPKANEIGSQTPSSNLDSTTSYEVDLASLWRRATPS